MLLAGSFVLGSRRAKAVVREHAGLAYPSARTLDIVATPTPTNPFCWSVLLVQREGAAYVVRLGRAATFPSWLSLSACPFDPYAKPSAPLRALVGPANAQLSLQSDRVPLRELASWLQSRCEGRAFSRFARVPYVTQPAADGRVVLGDLRYDRNPGLDFSDLSLGPHKGACPAYVPSWLPPRSDILSASE